MVGEGERVHVQCAAQQSSPEQTGKQHLGYSERCVHFHIHANYQSDIPVEERLFQIRKDPNIVSPLCTFPGFTGGCSPAKQWHKTKHGKPWDPGNKGTHSRPEWRRDRMGKRVLCWGLGMRPGPDWSQRMEGDREVPGKTTKAATAKNKLKRGMDELLDAFGN